MAVISSLHLYPVKSCRGLELDAATLGPRGLEGHGLGDRQWAVIYASGAALTQREYPALALVAPRPIPGGLELSAPGMPAFEVSATAAQPTLRAEIWGDEVGAIDAGAEAAARLSAYLGEPARLVRFDDREKRPSNPRVTRDIEALNRFSDGYPILLLSRASLADLNQRWARAGGAALPMDRFRPNVVLDGIDPYAEDHLASLEHAGFALRPVKACARCSIPSVDQATGTVGPAPLELLTTYRFNKELQGAVFGQNVVVARGTGATIQVGQHLEARWNF
ncbi:MAG: MOSC domain-containing protein [Betaproteobacteria bacterium]|nr:MOSC domain-containing protein [Betaproteobacteria bacterium]